jgi:hypothetical protein
MKIDEIAAALDKFMQIEAVSSIFALVCLSLTVAVSSNQSCGMTSRESWGPSPINQLCYVISFNFCAYVYVCLVLDLTLLLVCYVCENLYEVGDSFVRTIVYCISSFYSYIFEFFAIIYHHTEPAIGSTMSHCIVGLCIILLVVFVCFMLQKLNQNLRPKYTVPLLSFNVAVALNIDGISHNNYGVPICIVISALWIVLVKYSMEVETAVHPTNPYQPVFNDNRLEEGRALQNTRPNTRTTTRTTTNSSLLGEAHDQRVYDAITVGALTRIHTVGGHDHRIFVTDECILCLEKFGETTRALPCGHCFHDKCIQKWFVNRNSHPCPVCRQPSTVSGWLVNSLFQ